MNCANMPQAKRKPGVCEGDFVMRFLSHKLDRFGCWLKINQRLGLGAKKNQLQKEIEGMDPDV